MPIAREGDFLVWPDQTGGAGLGIESHQLERCLAQAKATPSFGVFGSPVFGFRERSLDFLRQLPHLRAIWFWDCEFDSVEGVYALRELAHCGVMKKRPGMDYSRLPSLETLVAHWHRGDSGFERCQVRHLHFWHFKPRAGTFDGLALPPLLETLKLNWVNPRTLDGLPVLPRLKELGIHRSRNLHDLSRLPVIAPNLKKLIVTTSSRVRSYAGVEDHPSLELAIIDGTRVRG